MSRPSPESIRHRLVDEFLASRLIENSLRGYWCEAMVAEALGAQCEIVSGGWHSWDLQLGPDKSSYPERLRIQVKNSARVQSWNHSNGKVSDTTFNLTYRSLPTYFERDFPDVPCEEAGFLCELFILCHHPIEDADIADHRDPQQWEFFLLPVVGPNSGVTAAELAALRETFETTKRPSSTNRRPETLSRGIRGRPEIHPVKINALTPQALWKAVTGNHNA